MAGRKGSHPIGLQQGTEKVSQTCRYCQPGKPQGGGQGLAWGPSHSPESREQIWTGQAAWVRWASGHSTSSQGMGRERCVLELASTWVRINESHQFCFEKEPHSPPPKSFTKIPCVVTNVAPLGAMFELQTFSSGSSELTTFTKTGPTQLRRELASAKGVLLLNGPDLW